MRVGSLVAIAVGSVLVAGYGGSGSSMGRDEITRAEVRSHLVALQRIADRNGGNRAAGTPGYAASVAYVARETRKASLRTTLDRFTARLFRELAPPEIRIVQPRPRSLRRGRDVLTLSYSGSGRVVARVQPVDVRLPPGRANSSTSGCQRSDFRRFGRGRIALLQRGSCPFAVKARNAQAAGARAVLVFNEGQAGRREPIQGTLGERSRVRIPVVAMSYGVGRRLVAESRRRAVVAAVRVRASTSVQRSSNVIAELPGEKPERVVMLGAHLDSVPAGPGINDNGSGVALVLAVARELARARLDATVRLAFWGAEELGLLGSSHYVDALPQAERERISVYLNFDMVGSPNFARLVYAGAGVPQHVERALRQAFARRGLASATTNIGGASDHAPFTRAGIAAGGLFTGAGSPKSRDRARVFGGRAGRPYDPCYHRSCDRLANVSATVLQESANAALDATRELAGARP